MRHIGLFGGTFNPVHLAHLRTAEEVREARALDRVDFVLSAVPPHKDAGALESVEHRRRMLELALADHPQFALNPIELERPGRSYSIDTIRACRAADPQARFTFILGADAFAEIESWKDFADIFAACDVCVISRPGSVAMQPPIAVQNSFCYDSDRRVYAHVSGTSLVFLAVTALMISASDIRRRCALGLSIRYLVPAAVDAYIGEHRLYRGRGMAH
jgi:nicotinate-nucleotide adenylyltransferase